MKRKIAVGAISTLIAMAVVAILWMRQSAPEPVERIQLEPPTARRDR